MLINKQITIFHGSISVVWKMLLERLYYHNILILKSYSLKLIELTQSSKTIRMTYKSSFKRGIRVKFIRMIRDPGIMTYNIKNSYIYEFHNSVS